MLTLRAISSIARHQIFLSSSFWNSAMFYTPYEEHLLVDGTHYFGCL